MLLNFCFREVHAQGILSQRSNLVNIRETYLTFRAARGDMLAAFSPDKIGNVAA